MGAADVTSPAPIRPAALAARRAAPVCSIGPAPPGVTAVVFVIRRPRRAQLAALPTRRPVDRGLGPDLIELASGIPMSATRSCRTGAGPASKQVARLLAEEGHGSGLDRRTDRRAFPWRQPAGRRGRRRRSGLDRGDERAAAPPDGAIEARAEQGIDDEPRIRQGRAAA